MSSDEEYRTAAEGAGWHDRRARGRVRLTGRDVWTFLQALVSQDVGSIQPGQGAYAAYLTPQGRMITDMRIHRLADAALIDVAPGLAEPLAARLDSLIFSEDVRVSDVSATTASIGMLGAKAAETLARALAVEAGSLTRLSPWHHVASPAGSIAARTDDAIVPSYDVFLPSDAYEDAAHRIEASGAVPIAPDLVEVLRIEAGRPAFGVDMSTETIPLEAGLLDRAISSTKGCYVGQEVIVRVLHRGGGRVARRLVRLDVDPSLTVAPAAGASLRAGDRELGHVTSAVFAPNRRRVIALGYVQREAAEAGHVMVLRTPDGDVPAAIVGFAG